MSGIKMKLKIRVFSVEMILILYIFSFTAVLADDYKYYLLEGSPCIDAGDPVLQDNFSSTTDIKPLSGNTWNWVSFPRLANNSGVDGISLLEKIKPFPRAIDLWRTYLMELSYDMDWCPYIYAINLCLT
jgi:hypothetical protein